VLEHAGKRFRQGQVVYLRLRVLGFDTVLDQPNTCIAEPINKDGTRATEGPTCYYVDEGVLVDGLVTVKELEEMSRGRS